MKFTKMHGCGNDYIYVDCTAESQINNAVAADNGIADIGELAKKLSDRHFGIGGDGLILIKRGHTADFEMEMYNADGSRGAMCGNGIRCVAKYIFDHNLFADGVLKSDFTIESMGAVKQISIIEGKPGDKVCRVRVDMGQPALAAEKIPVQRNAANGFMDASNSNTPVIMHPLIVNGTEYKITCVSMGNPHAVVFLDKPPAQFDVCGIGPYFENHAFFPDRTNTEFAYIANRHTIFMRVWERGSGETWACGTGTCATVVAAILNDFVDAGEKVTVHLLGGDLEIEWNGHENDSVFMTGPAETVFEGEITEN